LFASKGPVPEGDHLIPFGVARIARAGTDLTIATAGQLVAKALEAADILASEGVSVEVIDMRTIQPLDVETVAASVRRTHRLLVVDEAYAMYGLGAELAQSVNELCFDDLDGPVARLHTQPWTHPFAPSLERAMLVSTEAIAERARAVIAGRADPIPRLGSGLDARAAAASPAPTAPPQAAARPVTKAKTAPADLPAGEPITMPFGDLTVSEGKLVKWLRRKGDTVAAGEHVADIETDKAVVEIESPRAGVLVALLAGEGDVVKMGAAIAVVG
jgi:2-oxoisovalerate dehydrogenase E1 component